MNQTVPDELYDELRLALLRTGYNSKLAIAKLRIEMLFSLDVLEQERVMRSYYYAPIPDKI